MTNGAGRTERASAGQKLRRLLGLRVGRGERSSLLEQDLLVGGVDQWADGTGLLNHPNAIRVATHALG